MLIISLYIILRKSVIHCESSCENAWANFILQLFCQVQNHNLLAAFVFLPNTISYYTIWCIAYLPKHFSQIFYCISTKASNTNKLLFSFPFYINSKNKCIYLWPWVKKTKAITNIWKVLCQAKILRYVPQLT